MILGIFDPARSGDDLRRELEGVPMGEAGGPAGPTVRRWDGPMLALATAGSWGEPGDPRVYRSSDGRLALVFSGQLYDLATLRQRAGAEPGLSAGELLLRLFDREGEACLDHLNGSFALALWDASRRELILARDRLGIEPLFVARQGRRLVFGSSLRVLLGGGLVERRLHRPALLQYLVYNYNPGNDTFVAGVDKLPGGQVLAATPAGVQLRTWWRLSFAQVEEHPVQQTCDEILEHLEHAVRLRLDPDHPPGILLSGGTDSSALVGLCNRLQAGPLRTFSFRCEGRSYDESEWARLVAGRFRTHHTELRYGPEHLALAGEAVRFMDEPFCDVGIELATFLLGKAARGEVGYLFSGEGGDELFAGHPVYTADKVAGYVDRLPTWLVRPITAILQRLPDGRAKKSLHTQLKRFSYSLAFPPDLLSHRWRAYYLPHELRDLCTAALLDGAEVDRVYDTMAAFGSGADGPEPLSRSLFTDFRTLVGFYLRRLELLHPSGLESRVPLLDHRLVEYAASIPARLKLRGFWDTKYIYRRALEPVVPREILYERPKVGHSVPLKNWMRDDPRVARWMRDILVSSSFRARGFFSHDRVVSLLDAHEARSHNQSHRLWGLVMLELWLTEVWDRMPAGRPAAMAGSAG